MGNGNEALAQRYAQKWKQIKGDKILKDMKLLDISIPSVRLRDGSAAPDDLFRFILASYAAQRGRRHFIDTDADEAASLLTNDSLCDALDEVCENHNGLGYTAILPVVCRFGSARKIKELLDSYTLWGAWARYAHKGRAARTELESALVLSDTRAAVVFLEQLGQLHLYAEIRGISVAQVYEKYLFDFGFDETGARTFDLGNTMIEVRLTASMGLSMKNLSTGKAVRMIPKKGVDPAVHKKVTDDLDDMRQNLKKALKIKQQQLWEDYLSGAESDAESWKSRYLANPFLYRIARIMVWAQGENTFVLSDAGPIDVREQPYVLTDAPIRIAHTMEMSPENTTAWQAYFAVHGLKQPFQQIWEHAYREEDIRADRYEGCRIRTIYLKNQHRRGIDVVWYTGTYNAEHMLRIKGFRLEARMTESEDQLEIANIQPSQWNRRANMIIAYLDRITLYDRIKKDDVSIMNQMNRFTMAQVREFIAVAQEHNAVNVTALLLEYTNDHFAEFDSMDEFSLDW